MKLNKLAANKRKLGIYAFSVNNKNRIKYPQRRFCVSRMKLLTSGDIELNPGPLQDVNTQITS